MRTKMTKADIKEAVKRVVYQGESMEAVVMDLRKKKFITAKSLQSWVNKRSGLLTANEKNKIVSLILNNKEDINTISAEYNIPVKTLIDWIKGIKRSREIANHGIYHEGIRRDEYKGTVYKRFTMDIGIKFSTIRFTELAYRSFCSTYPEAVNDTEKISELSNKYGLDLNHADRQTTHIQMALNYIVVINECFDNYLYNLYELLKEGSKKTFVKKKDKETILDCIISNLNCEQIKNSSNYQICNYYRLLRNAYIHDSNVGTPPCVEVLMPNKEKVKPNKFSKICFKDADIFTFVALELGKYLFSSLELDISKIAEKRDLYKKLNLKKYTQEKAEQKLAYLFSITLPIMDSEVINKEVKTYILEKRK